MLAAAAIRVAFFDPSELEGKDCKEGGFMLLNVEEKKSLLDKLPRFNLPYGSIEDVQDVLWEMLVGVSNACERLGDSWTLGGRCESVLIVVETEVDVPIVGWGK